MTDDVERIARGREREAVIAWIKGEAALNRKWRNFYREHRDADPDDKRAAQLVMQHGYYANAYEGIAEDIEAGDHLKDQANG